MDTASSGIAAGDLAAMVLEITMDVSLRSIFLPCLAVLAAGCSSTAPWSTSPPTSPPTNEAPGCTDDPGAPATPATPLDFGRREVADTIASVHASGRVCVATADTPSAGAALRASGVVLDARPESFAVLPDQDSTWVVGRDAAGAMYGAFELAERLRLGTATLPVAAPFALAPAVPLRAANLFLTLPAAGETSWWFLDPDFWSEYLDLMVRARLDVLDLHAMYDLDNTIFPNALLYFGTSASQPDVGVPAADRARNVAMLQTIVAMAQARGIQVGLMSYRADTSLDGRSAPQPTTDLAAYTREAVADVARQVPNLRWLGFRIGESQQGAAWYASTFIAGVKQAGTGTGIYTRTWLTAKADILQLAAAAGPEMMVESKYNGEHLGAPYVIAGGEMAAWGSYSYEGFLDPPAPYQFVFQVRAGGTHRIFRQASLERIRRVAGTFTLGGSRGFSLEAAHAYSPQRDFYHAPADVFSPWTFRRDELTYLLFGRLAYDPGVPDAAFRAALAARVGTDALWAPVQAASDIVPWILMAHTCGPDQRDFAPELELGGTVAYWAAAPGAAAPPHACSHTYHGPFDVTFVAGPVDEAADLLAGRPTARLAPSDVARLVLADAAAARAAAAVPIDPLNAEARDVVRECLALADLGEYLAHKLRAATALAVHEGSADASFLDAAKAESQQATAAWQALASDTAYIAPFSENLRMTPLGLAPFHWSAEVPWLADDAASIDTVAAQVASAPPVFAGHLPAASDWLAAGRAGGPGLASLTASPSDPRAPAWTVAVELAATPPAGTTVTVLWKKFSSDGLWAAAPATGSGQHYQVTVAGTGEGAMFAVEVNGGGGAWRYPDLLTATPYVVLPSMR
jgi:hypothetical protein